MLSGSLMVGRLNQILCIYDRIDLYIILIKKKHKKLIYTRPASRYSRIQPQGATELQTQVNEEDASAK